MKTFPHRKYALCAAALILWAFARTVPAATFQVLVAPESLAFSPAKITIAPGDTVRWDWISPPGHYHSVTSGFEGNPNGLFDSGIQQEPFSFSFTFPNPGSYSYYCTPHFSLGMVGFVIVEAAPTPTPCPSATPRPASQAQLLNISTRLRVETGDRVLIGGFIVTGNVAKNVILRAIGPSLTQAGVAGALADPVLELHAADGSLITSNDNWKDTQQSEIEAAGFAPQDDLESAIIAPLDPGAYTAIVQGQNASSGVALVEGYDLNAMADAQLANISTRGFVETEINVMIGGFILDNGAGGTNILVRALGPSLTAQGVTGALADPTLELRDINGALVESNNNWKETEECLIQGSGLPPQDDLESALLVTLPTGAYTAIVAGQGGVTGVGLVEVYRLP